MSASTSQLVNASAADRIVVQETSVGFFHSTLTFFGLVPSSLLSSQLSVIGLLPSTAMPIGSCGHAYAVVAVVENWYTVDVLVVPPTSVPLIYQSISEATGNVFAGIVTFVVLPEACTSV